MLLGFHSASCSCIGLVSIYPRRVIHCAYFIVQRNHLIGLKRTYIKLVFLTVDNLNKVKKGVFPAVRKNQAALKKRDALEEAAG